MRLTTNVLPSQVLDVATVPTTIRAIMTLVNMPHGVQKMSHDVEGLVQTSLNLGVLRTNKDDIIFTYSVKVQRFRKKYLIEKIRSLADFTWRRNKHKRRISFRHGNMLKILKCAILW